MTVFKRIVTADQVEDAVVDTAKLWMVTYIAEIERQTGRTAQSLPVPRAYERFSSFDMFAELPLPGIVVESHGTTDDPTKQGDSSYVARWEVDLTVVVSAKDALSTRELAGVYTAAIRAMLLQRPSLGGFARGLHWHGESYGGIPTDSGRTIAAGTTNFTVEVDDVVTSRAGPKTVPVNPYGTIPEGQTATSVGVVIEKVNSIP